MEISKQMKAKYLLSLLYLLALLLVACLLLNEQRRQGMLLSLSDAALTSQQGVNSLSLYGENFHQGLKGVLVSSLVNEKAMIWHLLANVSTKSVDVAGDLALISCYDNKLVSVGFFQQDLPKLLGSIELPGKINQIQIVGDRAVVGLERHAGIALIDIRNPDEMKLLEHYPMTGMVSSMVVHQGKVYFVDRDNGIGRIDLSSEKPVLEPLIALNSAWRIALSGNKLAVGTLDGSLQLFNLDDTDRLLAAGARDFQQVVAGLAFTEEALAVALTDGTLHVYRLSSWPLLDEIAELKLPKGTLQLKRIPGHAGIAASQVANGVVLVDLKKPSTPRISGKLKVPETFYDLQLHSGYIYGASIDGLKVFALEQVFTSLHAPLAPETVIDPEGYDLSRRNGHVYGFSNNKLVDLGESESAKTDPSSRYIAIGSAAGVDLFEVSEGRQPHKSYVFPLEETAIAARFVGGRLFVVNREGLQVFSGDRPEVLVKEGELPLPGHAHSLSMIDSGHLVIITKEGGFLVVDSHDSSHLRLLASLFFPPPPGGMLIPKGVLVDGDRVYVSFGDCGVYVVALSDPSHPELRQIVDTPGHAKHMALYDDLLLVADGREGVFMIDVKNRSQVMPIGSWPMPVSVEQLAVAQDKLLVSGLRGGTLTTHLPRRLQDLQIINRQEGRAKVKIDSSVLQYVYLYDEQAAARDKVAVQ